MAYVPFNSPNIDRIIDRDYESYVDKLLDEATADNGERCKNCTHFIRAYGEYPSYCDKNDLDSEEDYEKWKKLIKENEVDPDDCCEHWEWDMVEDEPEKEY